MLSTVNFLQDQIVPIFTGRRYVEAGQAHFEIDGDFKSGDFLLNYDYEEIDPRKLFGFKRVNHSGVLRIRHKAVSSVLTGKKSYAVLFSSVNDTREAFQKLVGGFSGIARFLAPYLQEVRGGCETYFFYIENESSEMTLFYSLETLETPKHFWAKRVTKLEWANERHQHLRKYPPAGSQERLDYIFNNCSNFK